MSDVERIGHADREAAVADLKTHAAAGRISSKEYEERSLKVGQASTWADLTTLFGDLPEPRPRAGGQAAPPPYGPAPAAPPYGDSSSTGAFGQGSGGQGSGSSGAFGGSSPPTGLGRPPAPYGGNYGADHGRNSGPTYGRNGGRTQPPVGPANWGGGLFGNSVPPSLRRVLPLLPIILVGLMVATHAWFLVFLFPVAGALFGGSRRRNGGRRGNNNRNRRGRDFF